MRMTRSGLARAIIRSPAVMARCAIDGSSRNPESGSAYTGAPRRSTKSRTRARSPAARPPRITMERSLIDQRFIELDIDAQRADARPRCRIARGVDAEDRLLLDGLRRAGAAVARRTVGGDEDERQAGVVRLDRRGEHLRHRGPRGGDDRDRTAGELGAAEGEERGGALVDERVDRWLLAVGRRTMPLGQRPTANGQWRDQ